MWNMDKLILKDTLITFNYFVFNYCIRHESNQVSSQIWFHFFYIELGGYVPEENGPRMYGDLVSRWWVVEGSINVVSHG